MSESEAKLNIDGEERTLTRLNTGLAMFRDTPEMDYLDYWYSEEDDGPEHHTLCFDRRELVIWMGAVALSDADQRILHLSNRQHGTFRDRFGWNPIVMVEDYPSVVEEEAYIAHTSKELEDEKAINHFIEEGN